MNLKMFYNLFKAKRAISPSREFKRVLWKKLDAKWETNHLPDFRWYERTWFRTAGAAMASVLGFATVGTGVYAYNSPEVTEGSTLYPVKVAIEKIEENTKTTPENKAKFLLKKIERREKEKEVLEVSVQETETKTKVEVEIKETDKKITEVEIVLEKIDKEIKNDEKNKELKKEIKKRLDKRNKGKSMDENSSSENGSGKNEDNDGDRNEVRKEQDEKKRADDQRGGDQGDDDRDGERDDDRDGEREDDRSGRGGNNRS